MAKLKERRSEFSFPLLLMDIWWMLGIIPCLLVSCLREIPFNEKLNKSFITVNQHIRAIDFAKTALKDATTEFYGNNLQFNFQDTALKDVNEYRNKSINSVAQA